MQSGNSPYYGRPLLAPPELDEEDELDEPLQLETLPPPLLPEECAAFEQLAALRPLPRFVQVGVLSVATRKANVTLYLVLFQNASAGKPEVSLPQW